MFWILSIIELKNALWNTETCRSNFNINFCFLFLHLLVYK